MATDTERQPLGLPEGSVRAVLALQITLSFWMLVILPDPAQRTLHIPLNLYFLLAFVFMFFVSYGHSAADTEDPEPSPLGLPPLLVQIVILFGTAAILWWQYSTNPDRLKARLAPDELKNAYRFGAALLGGFMVGFLIRAIPGRNSAIFQFIHAWLSMIAMFMLVVEIVVHAFISPTLEESLDVATLEMVITAIVACYFGTRS